MDAEATGQPATLSTTYLSTLQNDDLVLVVQVSDDFVIDAENEPPAAACDMNQCTELHLTVACGPVLLKLKRTETGKLILSVYGPIDPIPDEPKRTTALTGQDLHR